ncbi:hypothetical protein [Flavobacterium kingsejongi]|uniref:Uncharacterized protein n=1 Tax=Flavobacterium kingsejongi TaxID=1678728 RepID=A0A2S1LQ07_9FLAO|nr:hypothetical protein [Flavobacterium kingsejongi]AWG25835.1 hypothetical protein FK004_11685 [Flavobacterium kingsejongi]
MNELLEIVTLHDYNLAIKTLTFRNKLIIDNKINDAHIIKYKDYKEKANINLNDIVSILESKDEMKIVVNYVSKKLVKYDGCDEQEYPDGEEPDEDEKDIIVSSNNEYYITFLIYHLIEYCVLKKNRDYIDEYVKLIRIPNSKKYAKELKEIFAQVKN